MKIRFASPSPLQADLRERVDGYFEAAGVAKTANFAMVVKSLFWAALAIALFAASLFELVSFPASLALSALLGFTLACIGFNIGHDAIHGCYAKRAWLNRALSWSFDLMGASSSTWAIYHNIIHHTYTNVCGVDQDLEPGPFLRFHPQTEPPSKAQRFQHFYAWILYGFIGFIWVFVKDFRQMRAPQIISGERPPRRVIANVVVGKLAHLGVFLALPLAIMSRPAWQVVVGYAVMLFVAGVTLAIVFQLAHVVEGVTFRKLPDDGVIPLPWVENELATTADFGRSQLATFITGGLDHQVEHHLFPHVCHIHYPALAPIVSACAREHGRAVIHNGSFFAAVASHARVLARLGRDEIAFDQPIARVERPRILRMRRGARIG